MGTYFFSALLHWGLIRRGGGGGNKVFVMCSVKCIFGTAKPGNKRLVMVIDRYKYVISSVLTGTTLNVSVTLSSLHYSAFQP